MKKNNPIVKENREKKKSESESKYFYFNILEYINPAQKIQSVVLMLILDQIYGRI